MRSSFGILFTTVFLDYFGFFIVLPYLFFLAQSLGATPFAYGLLISSYALMQFIFAPILGRLSDRYGRRRVILLSLLGAGISYFIFGIASSLWLLFAGRILAGCTSSTLPVAQSYVADVTSEEARVKYIAILGSGIGLGMIVGPAVGGILSNFYGYAAPSFLASALALANFAAACFRLPEPASRKEGGDSIRIGLTALTGAFRQKAFALLLPATFIATVAFVFENAVASPWLQATFGYGSLQVGLIFAYSGVIFALTQGVFVPKMSKRYSATTIALTGLVAITAAYAALGALPLVAVMLPAAGVLTIGFGLTNPTLSSLVSLNAGRGSQGSSLGAAASLNGLAQAVTPAIATSTFSLGVSFGMSGFVMVVAAAVNATVVPLLLSFRRRGYPGASRIGGPIRTASLQGPSSSSGYGTATVRLPGRLA